MGESARSAEVTSCQTVPSPLARTARAARRLPAIATTTRPCLKGSPASGSARRTAGSTASASATRAGTRSSDFDTSPPPSGGFQYASDCPDNNPIGGAVDPEQGAADKNDTFSSCLFHGIDGDARLTMRDAIIARKGAGVKTSNPGLGHYSDASTLKIPVFGGATAIPFTRGWASVDANVRGKKFHFVDTHLESESVGTFREDQAAELVAAGGPASQPNTVLVGDLNSDPSIQPGSDPNADEQLEHRVQQDCGSRVYRAHGAGQYLRSRRDPQQPERQHVHQEDRLDPDEQPEHQDEELVRAE